MAGRHNAIFQRQMLELIGLEQGIFCHQGHLANKFFFSSARQAKHLDTHVMSKACRIIDMCVKKSMLGAMNAHLPRPRGSKELWLNAAYDLLISDGIDAVKVMPLAKSLNLTRTGFYWFFKDIAELHAAMIEMWENKNTGTLVDRCDRGASNICEALFNLMDCWLNPVLFDAPLDLAIRNWARNDAELQYRVNEADKQRIASVSNMFARHGFSPEQAEVRGMTVIYTQIGYISMEIKEDVADRYARVQQYVELFAGVRPSECDVEKFLLRQQALA